MSTFVLGLRKVYLPDEWMCQVDTSPAGMSLWYMQFFVYMYLCYQHLFWDELPCFPPQGVTADSCVKYITIAPRDKSLGNTYGRMDVWKVIIYSD